MNMGPHIQTLRPPSAAMSRLVVQFRQGANPGSSSASPVAASTRSVLVPPTYGKPVDLGTDDLAHGNTFLSALKPSCGLAGATTVSRVRGSCGVAQKYQCAFHIFSKESLVYRCRYFKLNYYPPDHFLSVLRKSKPAVNVRETGEAYFNNNFSLDTQFRGDVADVQKRAIYLFRNNPSFLPRQYAIYRRRCRTFVREHMVQEWCQLHGSEAVDETVVGLRPASGAQYLDPSGRTNPGVAKDGLYAYQMLIFPDEHNHDDLSRHIRKSVKSVASLQWDKFLQSQQDKNKTWVQVANGRVVPGTLNKLLAQDEHSFTVTKG